MDILKAEIARKKEATMARVLVKEGKIEEGER